MNNTDLTLVWRYMTGASAFRGVVLIYLTMGYFVGLMYFMTQPSKNQTENLIGRCHERGGTARLNRNDLYSGCLVPPRRTAH